TSNFASVWFHSAANKETMMSCVKTRGMRHGTSTDWPLGGNSAFFKINDLHVTLASHNVSHSDVQSFSRRLDSDAGRITARQFDASYQFRSGCVDDFDRRISSSVFATAVKVVKHFDGRIEQMRCGIVRR